MGEREIIYLSLHCHHQNDPCIKMDSDGSHFNVSLILRDSHKTVSTYHKALTVTTFKIHITAELAMLNLQSSTGRRRYFGCRAIQITAKY